MPARAAGSIPRPTPDAYLYLRVPEPVAVTRQAERGPVAAHLMHPQVRDGIDSACRAYLSVLPPSRCLELDGTVSPMALAATVARFLPGASSALPAPDWRTMTLSGDVAWSQTGDVAWSQT